MVKKYLSIVLISGLLLSGCNDADEGSSIESDEGSQIEANNVNNEEDTESPTEAAVDGNHPNTDGIDEDADDFQNVGIGEEIFLGELKVTVNSIKKQDTIGDVTADGQFLIAEVTVTNTATEAKSIRPSMFKVTSGNGEIYDADSGEKVWGATETNFFEKDIEGDASETGVVVFEVPKNATDLQLEISTLEKDLQEKGIINLEEEGI